MSNLKLTIAISDYDHVRDFAEGKVKAEGIEANFLSLQVEEIFFRFLKFLKCPYLAKKSFEVQIWKDPC